jgi:hypothetical protein
MPSRETVNHLFFDVEITYEPTPYDKNGCDGIYIKSVSRIDTGVPKEDVFIAIEDDGSQWVRLEDYQIAKMAFFISELSVEKQQRINSELIQRIHGNV